MKVKEAILTLNANVVIACERAGFDSATVKMVEDALNTIEDALKEQESMPQKAWNALWAEEDDLEKKYVGTDEHNSWFMIYRPWLQRGFEIAMEATWGKKE